MPVRPDSASLANVGSDTRSRILDAAFACFAAQGYAGTAMADIARAAGLSRTALYNHFPDRDAVFLAAVQRVNDGVLAAVTAAAQAPHDSLAAHLAAVLEARAGWAFELLRASPHGRELIDEKNRLCGPLSAATNARFLALLERIIRSRLKGMPALPPRQAAALLNDAAAGLLQEAVSEAALRKRLRQLARIFAAGLAAAEQIPD